jgi:hypothetical protein
VNKWISILREGVFNGVKTSTIVTPFLFLCPHPITGIWWFIADKISINLGVCEIHSELYPYCFSANLVWGFLVLYLVITSIFIALGITDSKTQYHLDKENK